MHLTKYTSNQLYRRLHVGHPSDVDIYRRLCRGAHRVLDLGCGWGRIALPLAESGHLVVGLDIEPEFLQECAEQAQLRGLSSLVHVIDADACAAVLDHRVQTHGPFERVLFPYNTLYALGGAQRVTQCLSNLVAHLATDAEVWFDAYDVDEFHSSLEDDEDSMAESEEPDAAVASWEIAGHTVDVFELSQVSRAQQRLTVSYQARLRETGQQLGDQTLGHDYLLASDLDEIFDAAGYSLAGCYPRRALLPDSEAPQTDDDEGSEQLFYLAYHQGAQGLRP